MESNSFHTVAEFNKAYEDVRNDILSRHFVPKGTKVKLKKAIMMYQKFNDNWTEITHVKSDMRDRVKMYNNSSNGEFKLKALV